MTPLLVVLVLALVVIAGAAVVGPRLGVASPLVLVGIGVAASFLPVVGPIEIEPEWILAGVLPPLLYSSAVSMPAMNFRREFGAISGLSVLLVVDTSLVLGLFFQLVLPDLGFAWGVALGAIVSPTDAVATSIVKGTSVSRRVVAMLDGESLLNDATALVLLRTAIAAAAASFSFWGALGSFGYSVLIAGIVGGLVGWLNLAVRRRVQDPTVNTILSFTVPFLASVPAELLGASGLVAAVVAGVVTGIRAPLGWREGTAVVWAGMRGAVTVAAAQTLPDDAPQRPLLVLIAYAVAAASLLLQGGTIGPLLRRIAPPVPNDARAQEEEQQRRLGELMRATAEALPPDVDPHPAGERSPAAFDAARRRLLTVLAAPRSALLDARDAGTFDADVLEDALADLDASEIAIELRGRRGSGSGPGS